MASYVKNSLFIRNLSPNVTEKALKEIFTAIDAIDRISFRAFPNQNHQFFAQIDFKSSKGVTEGTKLNGTKIMGVECLIGVIDPITAKLHEKLEQGNSLSQVGAPPGTLAIGDGQTEPQGVQAEYFKKQKEDRQDKIFRSVHMTGFLKGVTEEVLTSFCTHFGEVLKVRIEEPEEGEPFAIVEFKERGAAHVVKTQREYLVDGRVMKFSEAKTMVDDVNFTEQAVHFQAPVFDTLNMRAVLAQQGVLNSKLAKVREAAMTILTGEEPQKDDEAPEADSTVSTAQDKPEDSKPQRDASESRERKRSAAREDSRENRHMDKKKRKKEKEQMRERITETEKKDADTDDKEFNVTGKWVLTDSKSGDKFKYYWTQRADGSFTGEQRGAGKISHGRVEGDRVSWHVLGIKCIGRLVSASQMVDGRYYNKENGKKMGSFTGVCQDAHRARDKKLDHDRQRLERDNHIDKDEDGFEGQQKKKYHRDRRRRQEASRSQSQSRVKMDKRSKRPDAGESEAAPDHEASAKEPRKKKKKAVMAATAEDEDQEDEEIEKKARRKKKKAVMAAAAEEDQDAEDKEGEEAEKKLRKKKKKADKDEEGKEDDEVEKKARRKKKKATMAAAEEEDKAKEDKEDEVAEKARRKAAKAVLAAAEKDKSDEDEEEEHDVKKKERRKEAKPAEEDEGKAEENEQDQEAQKTMAAFEAAPGLSRLELLKAAKQASSEEESEEDSSTSTIDVEEQVEVVENTEYIVMGPTSSSSSGSGSSRSASPVRASSPKREVEFVANPWAQGPDAIEMDVLKSATVELDATCQVDCDEDDGEYADISSTDASSSSSSSSEDDSPVRELAGELSDGENDGVLSDGEDDPVIHSMALDVELHGKALSAAPARRKKVSNGRSNTAAKVAKVARRIRTIDLGLIGGPPPRRRQKVAVNADAAAGLVLD